MGSGIGWTNEGWPVVLGCTHVSPGCRPCYSAVLTSTRLAHRPEYNGLAVKGLFTGEVRLLPQRLDWPLRWRDPRRVFVCSMSDLLHEQVPDEFIAKVFAVMALAPQHMFQVLTKRHGRLRRLLSPDGFEKQVYAEIDRLATERPKLRGIADQGTFHRTVWPLPNAWAGVSVENQEFAYKRIPKLVEATAAVRWLSVEPLLGPVDLTPWLDRLDWVVVGGQTGAGHQPMDPRWLESVVGQCQTAGVPVFVKQDSGPWPGKQGRIPDELWQLKQYPRELLVGAR